VSFPGPQERPGGSWAQLMLRVVAHPSYHSKAMASPGRRTPATSTRLSGAGLDISGKGGEPAWISLVKVARSARWLVFTVLLSLVHRDRHCLRRITISILMDHADVVQPILQHHHGHRIRRGVAVKVAVMYHL